jgi:hypothetical protein
VELGAPERALALSSEPLALRQLRRARLVVSITCEPAFWLLLPREQVSPRAGKRLLTQGVPGQTTPLFRRAAGDRPGFCWAAQSARQPR